MDEITRLAYAARADRNAWGPFVRATSADVWRLSSYLVDSAAADDLTQETYLRALPALKSYEGRAPARLWLLGIARRVAADHVRTVVRRRRLDARVAGQPRVVGRGNGDEVELTALVAALDRDRRACFVLTQLLGLSYAETAEVLGCPVGTVRSRVARAREDLLVAMREEPTA